MSYRTYINNTQVFGNNEYYPEWIEFMETQGTIIDEFDEGRYEGEIKDFMAALNVVESIVLRLEKETKERVKNIVDKLTENGCSEEEIQEKLAYSYGTKSIFDWRHTYDKLLEMEERYPDDKYNTSLLDGLREILDNGYIFMPYQFLKACEDVLEELPPYSVPCHFRCYKIKDGCKLIVKAN